MTFVLNQSQVDLKHPFDLDADQIRGAFIKNDKVRFYECEFDDEGDLTYNEVHVKKDICKKGRCGRKSGRYGKDRCRQTSRTQRNKIQRRQKFYQEQHICHGFGRL